MKTTLLFVTSAFLFSTAQAYNIDGITDHDPEFVFVDLDSPSITGNYSGQVDIAAMQVRPLGDRVDHQLNELMDERQ